MNEDLHDIDKLFTDGLDAHLEEAPPSVWEEVSHDLDKKQAAHYKHKYQQLKRAGLLLLLLMIMGGGVVLYRSWYNSQPGLLSLRSSKNGPVPTSGNDNETINRKSNTPPLILPADTGLHYQPADDVTARQTGHSINGMDSGTASALTDQSFNSITKARTGKVGKQQRLTNGIVQSTKQKPFTYRLKSGVTKPSVTAIANGSKPQLPVVNQPGVSPTFKQLPSTDKPLLAQPMNKLPTTDARAPMAGISGRSMVPFSYNSRPQATERNVAAATKAASLKAAASHRFYVSAFFSPNISFGRLEDDRQLAGPGRNREAARREERPSSSVTTGVQAGYQLSKKVAVQTGVQYTTTATGLAPARLFARPDGNGRTAYQLNCSSGYSYLSPRGGRPPAVGDSITTLGATSTLAHLAIPAMVSITIQKGKFSVHPMVGIGANILTGGHTQTALNGVQGKEETSAPISGLKKFYLDGRLGIGAEYGINKKLSLAVQPTARLAFSPINEQTPVRSYQNYLSVEMGVKLKL